jgi:hypothetical protein
MMTTALKTILNNLVRICIQKSDQIKPVYLPCTLEMDWTMPLLVRPYTGIKAVGEDIQ